MRKMFVLIFIFTIFVSTAVQAWPWSKTEVETTDQALGREKGEFQDLVISISGDAASLSRELQSGREVILTFREAVKKAADRNVEFRKVKDKWKVVSEKNKIVEDRLVDLCKGADEFYKTAEDHGKSIHDENLRKNALEKITDSRTKYVERLKSVRNKLKDVARVKTKVDDTMKFLELNFALEIIEEEIQKAFNEIEQLIPALMQEMQALDMDSQNLLKSTLAENTSK